MADSTLVAIRTKVRRLVRAPSEAQITDTQIDEYVNTFMLYDLPAHLQLEDLRDQITFFTEPGKDIYLTRELRTTPSYGEHTADTLWADICVVSEKPIYIAGNPAFVSQSTSQFYTLFPARYVAEDTGLVGDGVTLIFTGTLQNQYYLRGYPTNSYTSPDYQSQIDGLNGMGRPMFTCGNDYTFATTPVFFTGDFDGRFDTLGSPSFSLVFTIPPEEGVPIIARYVPIQLAQPNSCLFWKNTFILRPVPDAVYPVTVEVRKSPMQLLNANESPQIKQWWQYIAYGSAKKILEDRMDLETVAQILPEFKQQEDLVLRRTLLYQANERSATIYTEQTGIVSGFNSFWGSV